METTKGPKLDWGDSDGSEYLAPLPADLDGAIDSVKCRTKRQAAFVAALIAFAPNYLRTKAWRRALEG